MLKPGSASSRRRFLRRGDAQRGDASVENVLIFPVFAVMIFAIIQLAIWMDAGNVAQAAATTAMNASRAYQSDSTNGINAGYSFLRTSGSSLTGPNVSVNRTATDVTVTVTGTSLTIIPGLFPTQVTRSVTAPVERWVD